MLSVGSRFDHKYIKYTISDRVTLEGKVKSYLIRFNFEPAYYKAKIASLKYTRQEFFLRQFDGEMIKFS